MDQMQGIGDGIEHHPRAAEDAGPLADRTGQAVLVAVKFEWGGTFSVDLFGSFFEEGSVLIGSVLWSKVDNCCLSSFEQGLCQNGK